MQVTSSPAADSKPRDKRSNTQGDISSLRVFLVESELVGSAHSRTEGCFIHVQQTSAASKRHSMLCLSNHFEHRPSPMRRQSPRPAYPHQVRPLIRYIGSFANRTRRFTSPRSRAEEMNTTSGRGSSDSKERSYQLNEGMEADPEAAE